MWIFLGIVAFIVLLITIILLLPIYVTIKIDQTGKLIFRYKILHKTFGENPDPNNPIVKALKKASGITRLEKEHLKESAQKGDFLRTLTSSSSLLTGLFKRLLHLLKHCKINVLKVNVVCTGEDAAQAAINYGRCYAIISPLLGFLHSAMKINTNGERINITCNFETSESYYDFETILIVRVFRAVGALLRAAMDEAKRDSKQEITSQKISTSD